MNMKLFGIGRDTVPAKVKAEQGEGQALTSVSVDRAFEKYGSDKAVLEAVTAYNELLVATETTKRASVLNDRQKLAALREEVLTALAARGVQLEFVPTRFNKRVDSSFDVFCALFRSAASV